MRSPFRWLLLLAFVVLNGFIVYWAWRNLSDGADEAGDRVQVSRQDPSEPAPSRKSEIVVNPSSTKEELYQASLELQGRTEKMAYDLIAKWKRDPVINLESDELTAAVESLPEADCILLPSGAIAIGSPMLPKPVKQDLDTAVAELLRAYRDATPDAVIKYMSGRGKIVDPALRKRMERAFVKQGISDLAKLTDEDVYRTMWTTFNANPHWSGLVADLSCRQFWDGKNVQFNRVDSFNQNIVIVLAPNKWIRLSIWFIYSAEINQARITLSVRQVRLQTLTRPTRRYCCAMCSWLWSLTNRFPTPRSHICFGSGSTMHFRNGSRSRRCPLIRALKGADYQLSCSKATLSQLKGCASLHQQRSDNACQRRQSYGDRRLASVVKSVKGRGRQPL